MTFNRGDQIAADLIDGIKHQRVKLEFGGPGEAIEITSGTRMPVEIATSNSPSSDAFGRFRTSQVFTLNDFKQVHANHNELIWTTGSVGSGSIDHNPNRASAILTVHTGSGDERIRQTKRHFRYQPGLSYLISTTGVIGPEKANVRKRMGYFNSTDGIYLQLSGSALSLVERNSVSGSAANTVVNQSDWNLDTLDGTGTSGVTLDPSKAQIFLIDFQWLGVGRVRCCFFAGGNIIAVHEFIHANQLESVYMSTPNLPIRWEITNEAETASPTTTEQICFSVMSEGEVQADSGIVRSANRGVTAQSVSTAKIPLISLRLQSGSAAANISDIHSQIVSVTAADFLWEAILNPTVSDAATWVVIDDSVVEVDTTRSGSVTGGTVLASGYGITESQGANSGISVLPNILPIHSDIGFGEDLAGNRDEVVIAVQQISGGPDDFLASMQWRELL